MQRKLLLFLLTMPLLSLGQPNKGEYVQYDGSSQVGTIQVISTGIAKNKGQARTNAVRNVFWSLFFVGIPGSQYESPMINDDQYKNDPQVLKLLDSDIYPFIIAETEIALDKKKSNIRKGIQVMSKLTINCDGIKQYLIKLKIIRKFGL